MSLFRVRDIRERRRHTTVRGMMLGRHHGGGRPPFVPITPKTPDGG